MQQIYSVLVYKLRNSVTSVDPVWQCPLWGEFCMAFGVDNKFAFRANAYFALSCWSIVKTIRCAHRYFRGVVCVVQCQFCTFLFTHKNYCFESLASNLCKTRLCEGEIYARWFYMTSNKQCVWTNSMQWFLLTYKTRFSVLKSLSFLMCKFPLPHLYINTFNITYIKC
jgi:hypothetical protein